MPLLNALSREEYKERIISLCDTYPNRKTWFRAKLQPWIMAGLVPALSKVQNKWRTYAEKNTNIEESGHWEDYVSTGMRVSLLGAILGYV